MGINTPHALGRSQRVFARRESTFGTRVFPTTSGGYELKVKNAKINTEMARSIRSDARSTRSHLERFTGKTSNTFEIETYAMGSGTAGTPPDVHELLLCAISGTSGYTNTASTSDLYACVAAQEALGSFSLHQHLNDVMMQSLSGCYVNEFTINASGGEPPTFRFAGGGKGHVHTGYSTLAAGISATNVAVVQTDDAANFEVGSVIRLGSDDGLSDSGYRVSAKSGASLTLLNAHDGSTPSITASSGAAVYPHAPTDTTTGSPISGNLGSIVLQPSGFSAGYGGASGLPITSFELTLNNNIKPIDDENFAQEITDYIPGFRTITGKLGVRARRDLVIILGQRKLFTAHDLTVTCGSTAGSRFVVTLDCQLDFSEVNVPEVGESDAGEVVFEVPFIGIADSAESEFELTFT